MFHRWAGITPKSFLQALTVQHAKQLLRDGNSVLETSLDVGLSGPGRLHDLCVTLESASPGEVKAMGAGWSITTGFADTPFGDCLLASGPRGICHVSFTDNRNREAALELIRNDWQRAAIDWDDEWAERQAAELFDANQTGSGNQPLKAYVRGTEFQLRVWRALLQIPQGCVKSYWTGCRNRL